ncbi:MAG: AraC family transcriptional regulator [Eubacteriales bacterium]|nr:AraC family transcriptional regulator [Eubacteriales bacterium]
MEESILSRLRVPTQEERRLLDGEALRREDYASTTSFEVDSRKLLPVDCAITLRKHTRFVAFPMHTHNYVEMMYMLSGQTVHRMPSGEEVVLRAGELLLFGRHAMHAIERAQAEDIAVNFIVPPAFFEVAIEMIGSDSAIGLFLIGALRSSDQEISFLHFKVSNVPPVQSILESMVVSLLEPRYATARINQTAMGLLFMHLSRYPDRLRQPSLPNRPHALVINVLSEIQDHYQEADFSALAKRRHVSLAYVSRLVRQATGKTATALLQERRLEKARELLHTTTLTIAEVGEAVGYSNTAYFTRLFKSRVGLNPSADRS